MIGRVLVAALAATAFLILAAQSRADRLPSHAQYKLFESAFKKTHRHDRITGIRVSTVSSKWAVVLYYPAPKRTSADAAHKPKMPKGPSRQYEHRSGKRAVPGKPPANVKNDLVKPLHVFLVYTVKPGNGTEDATETVSGSVDCGSGPVTWSYTVKEHAEFSWHMYYEIPDFSNASGGNGFWETPASGPGWWSPAVIDYHRSSLHVTDGYRVVHEQDQCGGGSPGISGSCKYTYGLHPLNILSEVFLGTKGLELGQPPASLKHTSCPRGYGLGSGTARWQTNETAVFAPIVLITDSPSGLGAPQYVTNADGVQSYIAVQHSPTSNCSNKADGSSCTDTLRWHGSLELAFG
jgi:hypothetical protein